MRRLDRVLDSTGGFAAIWGRRRVGKSRLLIEWSHRRDGLYTVADASAPAVQRRYLSAAAAVRFPGFADVEYPDWRSFFERLTADAAQARWPGPVILDEIPYLIAADPTITSVLQNWLDAPRPRPCLVVSGSSQQMMHGNLLDAGAPLYGRASEAFALRPLQPGYLQRAFSAAGIRELVSLHALWGGMPRYWELAQPFGSDLDSAVDTLVLDPAGALHDEPNRLLRAETPPATALRPLLDIIGAGAHRAGEIGGRLGKPVSSLARPLATLVAMNLVRRETPYGSDPKSGKRSLYRIDDPFPAPVVPGSRIPPRVAGRSTQRDPPCTMASLPAKPGSHGVGGTLPDVRSAAASCRQCARTFRALAARAAILARQQSGVRCRCPVGGRPAPAGRRGQVDGTGLRYPCPAAARHGSVARSGRLRGYRSTLRTRISRSIRCTFGRERPRCTFGVRCSVCTGVIRRAPETKALLPWNEFPKY